MPTPVKDYYDVLGVGRSATEKEIKAAFRKLARKHHPDVNPNDKAAEARFREISAAYGVLGDADKRKKYDQYGADWEQVEQWEKAGRPGGRPGRTSPGQSANFDFGDIFQGRSQSTSFDFGDIFGEFGSSRPQRTRRGSHVEGEVSITLEEAYSGTKRTVELREPMGVRRVEVSIPAGIADAATVRAKGQGSPGIGGGTAGDLLIAVHVKPHAVFHRRGDDLQVTQPVPLDVALLGGEVEVPTLGGKKVKLTIPAETQNHAKLRLRGLGMPRLKGSDHGDVIVEVDVRLPLPLSDDAKEFARRLRM